MNKPVSCYITLFKKLELDANNLEKDILFLVNEDKNKCFSCIFNNSNKIKKRLEDYYVLLNQLIELNSIILKNNLTTERNYLDNCIRISQMKHNIYNKCNKYIIQEEEYLLDDTQNIR